MPERVLDVRRSGVDGIIRKVGNSVLEALMGIANTQMLATIFDGITRHSPEGVWFKEYAEKHGFHAAVAWRDGGKPIPEGLQAVPLKRRKKR